MATHKDQNVATATEKQSLEDWRTEQFKEMGFRPSEAKKLATARNDQGWPVEIHKVREMIRKGCPHVLALQIIL